VTDANNQTYYVNCVTGETTWDRPAGLVQTVRLSSYLGFNLCCLYVYKTLSYGYILTRKQVGSNGAITGIQTGFIDQPLNV
jgi:hypothetical protein